MSHIKVFWRSLHTGQNNEYDCIIFSAIAFISSLLHFRFHCQSHSPQCFNNNWHMLIWVCVCFKMIITSFSSIEIWEGFRFFWCYIILRFILNIRITEAVLVIFTFSLSLPLYHLLRNGRNYVLFSCRWCSVGYSSKQG